MKPGLIFRPLALIGNLLTTIKDMKNEAKFNETVSILVRAYLNDTLIHGDCCACAVGNIISDGGKYHIRVDENCNTWFSACGASMIPQLNPDHPDIIRIGYSCAEIVLIERAFEFCPRGNSNDDWVYNGLMAVVDVLAEIHEIDLTVKESAKLLFVKA